MNVLSMSIPIKNKQLAENIISVIREDAQVRYQNEHEASNGMLYGDIYAHYTKDSKEQAKKIYEDALKNGKFD